MTMRLTESGIADAPTQDQPQGGEDPDVGLYRVLDPEGNAAEPVDDLSPETLRSGYELMVLLRTLDRRALNLQRQGRIHFYAPCGGQEAAIVGSALAMQSEDWCFPTYREVGACLCRGMSLETVFDQLYGNARDLTLGRQMPNHFASNDLRILSISSPIATQIPQAAGCGISQRIQGQHAATLCYLGDGSTSEGDFHAGMNFAGVLQANTVFFCQNNQWAITVPVTSQTASRTIAIKARAYGFPGVRVDGNDFVAVHRTVKAALERARTGGGPTLIEALTYRMGAHSTSDDPRRYRPEEIVEPWRGKDPLTRLQSYLIAQGLLNETEIAAIETTARTIIDEAVLSAEAVSPPKPETMFDDVLAQPTARLEAQRKELLDLLDQGIIKPVSDFGH